MFLLETLVPPLSAGDVTGRVELIDSRDPGVRKHGDRSGVVISLNPLSGADAKPAQPIRATITQKDKTFLPHMLAIPVGSIVDFPNLDPIFHNAFSSYNGQVFDIGLYPPGSTRSVQVHAPGRGAGVLQHSFFDERDDRGARHALVRGHADATARSTSATFRRANTTSAVA